MERNVILASKSPRRREILENLGLTVHVLAENPEIRTAFAGDEEELPGEKPDDYGRRITVEKEPDNPTYLDTFGWILYLQGRPEEAKSHFKHAMLYGGKDSAVILDHYAEVLYALGEYDLAFFYWSQAMSRNNGEIEGLEEKISRRKAQMDSK